MRLLLILALVMTFLPLVSIAEMSDGQDNQPIVLRGPAMETPEQAADRDRLLESTAVVDKIKSFNKLTAISNTPHWYAGEVVAIESQSPGIGIVAFVEVKSIESYGGGRYLIQLELQRHSRVHFVQPGDSVFKLDLKSENSRYKGTTDLLIRRRVSGVSAKYKPLVTQGLNIGETAQTLWQDEFLITWYGLINYGVTDNLSMSTVLTLDAAGAPNMQAKYKFFESNSNVLAAGLTVTKIPSESRTTMNLNFNWDGISSESMITHTNLSIALLSFDQAEEATAIKSLGTSSFQTGYEFALDNWDRVLLGPNYNFEKKAVGGYISYVKIWDKFHFSLSVNSTNISSLKMSPKDGYYFFFDAYWRF